MRVFGIDPGSTRTGYGCIDTDGRRHRLVLCGAIRSADFDTFPDRLAAIHRELADVLGRCRPECVAIENLFHASNVRSALKLGHARGVAMLAAVQAGLPVVEYTPAEIKRAVVGYGRAEKPQIQQMVKLLLGLDRAPEPHDAADALAVAICHLHLAAPAKGHPAAGAAAGTPAAAALSAVQRNRENGPVRSARVLKSWRHYKPA